MAEVAVSISQPNPTTLPDRFVTYHQARTADFGVAGQIADGVLRIRREHAAAKLPEAKSCCC